MSLLRDIQAAAVDSGVDLSDLLRKCLVLASRLRHREFKAWVERELKGYPSTEDPPGYRIIQVDSFGYFSGPFGKTFNNAPIPPSCVPKEYRDIVSKVELHKPIAGLTNLLAMPAAGSLESPWPPDLVVLVGARIYEGMNCLKAWRMIPRNAIAAVLDTVRTRILSFVLELEEESPSASEEDENGMGISPERVTQIFNTTISGNTGNVAVAGRQVSQKAHTTVQMGDLGSLERALAESGVRREDISELKLALRADAKEKHGQGRLGPKTSSWLAKMVQKAAEGTWEVSVGTAGSLLGQLFGQYLGLPV